MYHLGKNTAMKLSNVNKIFLDQAEVFFKRNVMGEDVVAAGEKTLVQLYKDQPDYSLNKVNLLCKSLV